MKLRWWYLPITAIVATVVWLLFRRRGAPSPARMVARERDAIEAGVAAKKLTAEVGADAARQAIEKAHAETVSRLDDEQKAEAIVLRSDPAKLASFLVKAAR